MSYPLTAIISDLHSNRQAMDTLLADAKRRGVERFVCLGDVIGYGAEPRCTLEWVMQLCIAKPLPVEGFGPLQSGICLQGNHEFALLNSAEDFNPKARAAIEWTRMAVNGAPDRQRSYDYWEFLDGLSPSADDGTAMFCHGSPRDPVREYLLPQDIVDDPKMNALFGAMTAPICFVGHSHVPAVFYEDRRLFQPKGTEGPYELGDVNSMRVLINVGSVGQPRDGDNRLSYVVFDGERVTFIRLDYDFESAAQAIREVPELPDYLADRLALGR